MERKSAPFSPRPDLPGSLCALTWGDEHWACVASPSPPRVSCACEASSSVSSLLSTSVSSHSSASWSSEAAPAQPHATDASQQLSNPTLTPPDQRTFRIGARCGRLMLKAGHGSVRGCLSPEWARWASPSVAVAGSPRAPPSWCHFEKAYLGNAGSRMRMT